MSVNQKLILAFSMAVATITMIGVGAYINAVKLIDATDWSEHTRQVIVGLQRVVANATDIETGGRGYVITGLDDYLEPYRVGTAQIEKSLDMVRALTADNPIQQQRLETLEPLVRGQGALFAEIIAVRQKSGFSAAQDLVTSGRAKKFMDDMRRITVAMIAEEERLLAARTGEAQGSAALTKIFALTSAVLGLTVVGLVGFAVTRTISSSLGLLTDAVTSLSSGAAEQVAAVSETMSTLEEIKATSSQTLLKSDTLGEASARALDEAQRGLDMVRRSAAGMSSVRERVDGIANMNLALSEQSKQIADITQVVAKLAQESKMLALNASIEAVKAGEAGKGFTVVAMAIRSLAERSEDATVQVQNILADVRNATDRAVMATEEGAKQVDLSEDLVVQSGETISALNEVVQEAELATRQIGQAIRQENLAIEQIANAMADIRAATGQFAAASDQTRLVAQRLTGNGSLRRAEVVRAIAASQSR